MDTSASVPRRTGTRRALLVAATAFAIVGSGSAAFAATRSTHTPERRAVSLPTVRCATQTLPPLSGGQFTMPNGVHASGVVVGSSGDHAVWWDAKNRVHSVDAPGWSPMANGANSHGALVGAAGLGEATIPWYRSPEGRVTRLALPPGWQEGTATAVNDRGQIIGTANREPASKAVLKDVITSGNTTKIGSTTKPTHQPVLWPTPTSAPILLPKPAGARIGSPTAINNAGTIVGSISTDAGNAETSMVPVVWPNASTVRKLPGGGGVVQGVNDSGTMVGILRNQAVRWSADGTVRRVFTHAPSTSDARAVDAAGRVVGSYQTGPNKQENFLWDGRGEPRRIVQPLEVTDIVGFSGPGSFVGTGNGPSGSPQVVRSTC